MKYDDGSIRDVTHLTKYEPSDPLVAEVGRGGLVTGVARGESAVITPVARLPSAPMAT